MVGPGSGDEGDGGDGGLEIDEGEGVADASERGADTVGDEGFIGLEDLENAGLVSGEAFVGCELRDFEDSSGSKFVDFGDGHIWEEGDVVVLQRLVAVVEEGAAFGATAVEVGLDGGWCWKLQDFDLGFDFGADSSDAWHYVLGDVDFLEQLVEVERGAVPLVLGVNEEELCGGDFGTEVGEHHGLEGEVVEVFLFDAGAGFDLGNLEGFVLGVLSEDVDSDPSMF